MCNLHQRIAAEDARLKSFKPIPPHDNKFTPLPASSAVCKLTAMKLGSMSMPAFYWVLDAKGQLAFECWAFLIESTKGKILFDLGIKKDCAFADEHTLAVTKRFDFNSPQDASQVLKANGVALEDIKAIVISHNHLDHVGDITGFPKSTELVFGPRTNKLDQKALSTILYVDESALEGRKITFLDQSSSDWKPVGAFNGIDYWGDGSLFLLDSPGHMEGHLAALVRTADSPSAYHLLAGDIAHHISLLGEGGKAGTPIGLYPAKLGPLAAAKPGEEEALACFEEDIEVSYATMSKAGRMDLEENINAWLAHDPTMASVLPQQDFLPLKGDLEELTKFKKRTRAN